MRIAVAMSGGVDSSVCALMLKNQGHEVIGITMRMDNSAYSALRSTGLACADQTTSARAAAVAEHIGIPFYEIDVAEPFTDKVLNYLKDTYLAGLTPNPCVYCNRFVKFGAFIERARESGIVFDKVATGHYANIDTDENGEFVLRKADFRLKDQSYFLSMLTQKQLSEIIFPLGHSASKQEIWDYAVKAGLPIEMNKESQDFLQGGYLDVVHKDELAGDIILTDGRKLGTHPGYWHYTIGQRKGLGVSYPQPLYVTNIDPVNNIVTVGTEESLYLSECVVKDINWINTSCKNSSPLSLNVRIRYRHEEQAALVNFTSLSEAVVKFESPQKSITSGQFAVFYDNDIVRGGGIIV